MSLPGQVRQDVQRARGFEAKGWAGSVVPARFVGATASGAPVSGTYRVADFVVTASGQMWVCTASGSPGTWDRSATKAEVDALELRVDDLEADVAALQATVADHESRIAALESP